MQLLASEGEHKNEGIPGMTGKLGKRSDLDKLGATHVKGILGRYKFGLNKI